MTFARTLPSLVGSAVTIAACAPARTCAVSVLLAITSGVVSTPLLAHEGESAHEVDELLDRVGYSATTSSHTTENNRDESSAETPGAGFEGMQAEPVVSAVLRQPATPTMSPVLGGSWSPVFDWPIVAVHAALLPNGKVLSWDATPDDSDLDPHTNDNNTTRVTLWDPETNSHISTNNDTDTDLFCAGSAHLWDGRILFAGGDAGKGGSNAPLSNTNIYSPVTNTWHRAANMNAPRWYSSVAALSNGEMLTMGGSPQKELVSEVFQFDQTWRALDGADPTTPGNWWLQIQDDGSSLAYDYQWIQATPEGSVISFGPQNILASIDTAGRGSWTEGPARDDVDNRDYGSYAMFDVGRILVAGGGNSVDTAVIIDTATQQTTDTSSMNIGRRQHNLTILADGSVLVTGGNTDGSIYYSPDAPTFIPELWNPDTGQFTQLNPMQGDRQYHSIALLLADGRVLSGGGGICGDCYRLGYEERNAEIFTPPYLYAADATLAPRPALLNVPAEVNYDQSISVVTGDGVSIDRAHLIKLGSATHSENQDQRLVPLTLSQTGSRIELNLPASRYVAPPGHYLLFLVDSNGVPSTGEIIKLGQPLVAVGETVRSTLEEGARDSFAYSVEKGQWQIELAAPGVELFITDKPPESAADLNNNLCRASSGTESVASCSVPVSAPTTLYLSITGSQRVDYLLNTALEPLDESTVEPSPTGTGGKPVRTGGGVSGSFVGFLLFFILISHANRANRRRICVNGG